MYTKRLYCLEITWFLQYEIDKKIFMQNAVYSPCVEAPPRTPSPKNLEEGLYLFDVHQNYWNMITKGVRANLR